MMTLLISLKINFHTQFVAPPCVADMPHLSVGGKSR